MSSVQKRDSSVSRLRGQAVGKHDIEILECTLRDGSYVIDFQFTPRDTSIIAAALENAGFTLIEVGHGVGLNASNTGKGLAAATDEEYMNATASTLKRAQWGMFFIPGIGRHEDLEMAGNYAMDFVRIGTNATEVDQSEEYIDHAKRLGMYVCANLMKSYVLPPKELAAQAKLSERFGADMACLVDSAGSMLPEDVRDYVAALQDVLTIPIGLHSHDNLGLGMANVLTAIDCGVRRIDSTLQGMGRGGGNPVSEVLVTVLKKRGIDLNIDLNRLMDVSERVIKPMLKDKGWDSIDITSGLAGFHSSHLETILKFADKYKLDPRDLIVSVCEVDQVYASEELVERTAQQLQRRQNGRAGLHIVSLPRFSFPSARETVDDSLASAVREVASQIRTTAKKKGIHSVFNVVAAPEPLGKATVSRFVQEEFGYIIGSVEVDNLEQLKELIETVDGIVDIVLVDSEVKPYLANSLMDLASSLGRRSRIIDYKDNDVWVRSVARQIGALLEGVSGSQITVCGSDNLALKLVLSLVEQGAKLTLTGAQPDQLESCVRALRQMALATASLRAEPDPVEAAKGAEVLVAFERGRRLITREMVEVLSTDTIIFDAGIGSVAVGAIGRSIERGIRVVRPDMRAALASELALLMGTNHTVGELMGRSTIAGISVVAGGLVGQYGEVVVDSVSNPSKVIGVADGKGRVLYRPSEFADAIRAVEAEIARREALIA